MAARTAVHPSGAHGSGAHLVTYARAGADNLAAPAPLPLADAFSIGDVLVLAGACWVLVAATRPGGRVPSSLPDSD